MHFMDFLTLSWEEAAAVCVTTVVMYAAFSGVLRLWGQRLYAGSSATTVATAAVLGAIVGRTCLGLDPDLEGGLVALTTLLLLERAFGFVRTGTRAPQHRAAAVMVAGRVDTEALRRVGLDEMGLWALLRRQGVADPAEVRIAVLECDGQVSVIRSPVDRAVL
ncbi:MAG: YetF domain-containing protein, partial [Nocardioides sp.]